MHVHKAMHAAIVLLSYDLKFMDHIMWGQMYRVIDHLLFMTVHTIVSVFLVFIAHCVLISLSLQPKYIALCVLYQSS